MKNQLISITLLLSVAGTMGAMQEAPKAEIIATNEAKRDQQGQRLHDLIRASRSTENFENVAAILEKDSSLVNWKDSNFHEQNALLLATRYQLQELIPTLLKHGANINEKDEYGNTPLMYIAQRDGLSKLANLLLKSGADVNARNNNGSTALMIAVQRDSSDFYTDTIKLLLDAGADITLQDKKGNTAKKLAAANRAFTKLLDEALRKQVNNVKK